MRKFIRKLKSRKGESFVEILIAILIVALGSLLIATMYNTSMDLNITASQQDDDYYKAVSEMEKMYDSTTEPTKGKVVIQEDTASGDKSYEGSIEIYGDEMSAYKRS